MHSESRSGASAQDESRLVWLISYARWYKAHSLYTKQRFAKGVQRNITDFLKASITTDSIKIFSITFCTLVTVYCTCKIAKDAFRIVLYVTTFYMQHCAVACFVLRANGASQEAPAHTLPVATWIDTLRAGHPCLLHNAILYTALFKIYANLLGTFLRKMGKSE